mgnify:FL=1
MSEIAEDYKELKIDKQQKKQNNLVYSTNLLVEKGIKFISCNGGVHLIVENKYNFYPSTGKICNKQNKSLVKNISKSFPT